MELNVRMFLNITMQKYIHGRSTSGTQILL